ncbi:hypothetical protein LOTGIDRAFT_234061 [Lottia gigantea]|uniref:Uncharacterized protein n=1 Tax=Lottia gigantea TaxID=225164 RepID=V4BM47_LOTGI|nr:hypothetical protein LOTGIDRAFT_234061 [Lottia gigantea]ESO89949.1 hypothetical protein LOTGIDRAFT_234061 [Lottia gigantea]
MTEMFPKKSSIHLFRPHSASRLKSDENVKFVGSKTRPSSAHPNPTSHGEVKHLISHPIDFVTSGDEDSPPDDYHLPVTKKKKKRTVISDPKTAVEVWLDKRKNNCTDEMHPFVNISLTILRILMNMILILKKKSRKPSVCNNLNKKTAPFSSNGTARYFETLKATI